MATGDRLRAMDLYEILLLTTRLARRATTSSIYRVARKLVLGRKRSRVYFLYSGAQKLNRAELEVACEDFSNINTFPTCTVFKGILSGGVEISIVSTVISSSKDWSRSAETCFKKKCLFLFDYFDSRTVILVRLLRFWDYQNTDRGYTVYFDSRTAKSYVHNSSSLHMTASFFSLLDSFHFCPLGYKDFPDLGNTTSSLLSTCCHVVLELWYNWSWVKATWSLEVIFPDGIFPADGKSEIEGKNKYFELFQFNKPHAAPPAASTSIHGCPRARLPLSLRDARWIGEIAHKSHPWQLSSPKSAANRICQRGLAPPCRRSPTSVADFVMPFFLFIVGVALALSYKRVPDKLDASRKALLRALTLFCLGLGLVLQGGFFHGVRSLSFGVDLREIRLMGVLQRIAIAYLLTALCEIWIRGDEDVDYGYDLLKRYCYQLPHPAPRRCLGYRQADLHRRTAGRQSAGVGWPPVQNYRKNTLVASSSRRKAPAEDAASTAQTMYVKVSMDDAPYLKMVDIKMYSSYEDLSMALEKMFSCFITDRFSLVLQHSLYPNTFCDLAQESLFSFASKIYLFLTLGGNKKEQRDSGETYQKTDIDFLESEASAFRDDGSTASTAILVGDRLYVANVGDSRAVIPKAGKAMALSEDHKPNRIDERKRIENACVLSFGLVGWKGVSHIIWPHDRMRGVDRMVLGRKDPFSAHQTALTTSIAPQGLKNSLQQWTTDQYSETAFM
ncbi:putative protein phosphatase 2C 13 [Zea mays]|uniref:Auxin-responsive protein n=1 Tax=Zea mays TaxID=4577 RepID=A0A3L6E7I7_MAIZE|nr:putative protein phosphatase 2C 13 [Zea mays]